MPNATNPAESTPILIAALLVALGGAAGSMARYFINVGASGLSGQIPAATLLANTVGCLLAGVLLFFVLQRDQPSMPWRLLLGTGFLGGLTTFSAFGFETIQLAQRGQLGAAGLNVAANVSLSLLAVFAGYAGMKAVA